MRSFRSLKDGSSQPLYENELLRSSEMPPPPPPPPPPPAPGNPPSRMSKKRSTRTNNNHVDQMPSPPLPNLPLGPTRDRQKQAPSISETSVNNSSSWSTLGISNVTKNSPADFDEAGSFHSQSFSTFSNVSHYTIDDNTSGNDKKKKKKKSTMKKVKKLFGSSGKKKKSGLAAQDTGYSSESSYFSDQTFPSITSFPKSTVSDMKQSTERIRTPEPKQPDIFSQTSFSPPTFDSMQFQSTNIPTNNNHRGSNTKSSKILSNSRQNFDKQTNSDSSSIKYSTRKSNRAEHYPDPDLEFPDVDSTSMFSNNSDEVSEMTNPTYTGEMKEKYNPQNIDSITSDFFQSSKNNGIAQKQRSTQNSTVWKNDEFFPSSDPFTSMNANFNDNNSNNFFTAQQPLSNPSAPSQSTAHAHEPFSSDTKNHLYRRDNGSEQDDDYNLRYSHSGAGVSSGSQETFNNHDSFAIPQSTAYHSYEVDKNHVEQHQRGLDTYNIPITNVTKTPNYQHEPNTQVQRTQHYEKYEDTNFHHHTTHVREEEPNFQPEYNTTRSNLNDVKWHTINSPSEDDTENNINSPQPPTLSEVMDAMGSDHGVTHNHDNDNMIDHQGSSTFQQTQSSYSSTRYNSIRKQPMGQKVATADKVDVKNNETSNNYSARMSSSSTRHKYRNRKKTHLFERMNDIAQQQTETSSHTQVQVVSPSSKLTNRLIESRRNKRDNVNDRMSSHSSSSPSSSNNPQVVIRQDSLPFDEKVEEPKKVSKKNHNYVHRNNSKSQMRSPNQNNSKPQESPYTFNTPKKSSMRTSKESDFNNRDYLSSTSRQNDPEPQIIVTPSKLIQNARRKSPLKVLYSGPTGGHKSQLVFDLPENHPHAMLHLAGMRLLSVAAVSIQRKVRCFLAKQESLHRMWAIITIQSYMRRWTCEIVLLDHVYSAIRIQAAFRGWATRDNLLDQHFCATEIQKVVRGYLGILSYHDQIYSIILAQSVCRRFIAINKMYDRLNAIICIQSHYRRYRVQTEINLLSMDAAVIQSAWRSFVGYTQYQFARIDIIIVQSIVRRWIAIRVVKDLKYQRDSRCAVVIQKYWRCYSDHMDYQFELMDIIICQSLARRWKAIKTTRLLRWEKHSSCAIIIQKHWRRYIVHFKFLLHLVQLIVVQSTVRRWFAVRKKKRMLEEKRCEAAVAIQRSWRGYNGHMKFLLSLVQIIITQSIVRRFLCRRKYSIRLNMLRKEREIAATVIQKHWRGFVQYSNFTITRFELWAATTIQRYWRGFWQYSHFVILQFEVTRIQSAFRGYQERKLLAQQEAAVLVIQRGVRPLLARKLLQREKMFTLLLHSAILSMTHRNCAKKIQRFFRNIKNGDKEKEAALVIERFFLWVKSEVDREIEHRKEKKKSKKHTRRRRKKRESDEKLLERVWLTTITEEEKPTSMKKHHASAHTKTNYNNTRSSRHRSANVMHHPSNPNSSNTGRNHQQFQFTGNNNVTRPGNHPYPPHQNNNFIHPQQQGYYYPTYPMAIQSDTQSVVSNITSPSVFYPKTPSQVGVSRLTSLSALERFDDYTLEESWIDTEISQSKVKKKNRVGSNGENRKKYGYTTGRRSSSSNSDYLKGENTRVRKYKSTSKRSSR